MIVWKRLIKQDNFCKDYSSLKDSSMFRSKFLLSVFILSQERVHLFNLDAVNNLIAWSSVYRRCIIHLFRPLLRGMFVSALNLIWLNRGLLIIKLNSYFPNSNSMIFFFLEWPSWYSSQVPHHVFILCCSYVFCQSVFSLWISLLACQQE